MTVAELNTLQTICEVDRTTFAMSVKYPQPSNFFLF